MAVGLVSETVISVPVCTKSERGGTISRQPNTATSKAPQKKCASLGYFYVATRQKNAMKNGK